MISGCKGENPCKNGGVCEEEDVKGFKCECPAGFISRLCDIGMIVVETILI